MQSRSELYAAVWRETDRLIDHLEIDWRLVKKTGRETRETIRGYESDLPWCQYGMDLFDGKEPQVQMGVYDDQKMIKRFFAYFDRYDGKHLKELETALGMKPLLKPPGAPRSAATASHRGSSVYVEAPFTLVGDGEVSCTAKWLVETSINLRATVDSTLDLTELDFS